MRSNRAGRRVCRNMHHIAIVIPAKNEARYLPLVLEALRVQTLQPAEVIVADGGSTDGTQDIARRFGAKVVLGGSVAEGRNAGAAATSSEFIVFLDADVLIDDPRFLERAVAEFAQRGLDLATSDVRIADGHVLDRVSYAFYNRYVRMWGKRHPHPIGSFMLVRRAVHDAIGGFDPGVYYAEDHDYGLRVRDAGFVFGILDDVAIGVTTRRQQRDGRLYFTLVNIFAALYIFAFGAIKTDIFRYRFGYGEHREDVLK